ncbi:MAG TPA: hypothetical protein DCQ20_00600 [Nitrospira sp.]|nr:hypothetical protein [Nitrospira sp.]
MTRQTPKLARDYYKLGSTRLEVLDTNGNLAEVTITNRSRESRVETIASRYKEILETSRVIGAEGYRFEISEVNRNQTKAALLHASTYRSSIPTSAGNVAELAHRHGSQHTVYVSSFGRGRTSPLENPELRFLAKHGSLLTATDGEAITLPVARALLIALENEGIRICGVRSDSSGRLLTDAFAFALPSDSLTTVFHNSPPGIGRLGRARLIGKLAYDDFSWSRRLAEKSPDPARVSRAAMREAEHYVRQTLHTRNSRDDVSISALRMAWAALLGLAAPARDIERCPVLRDARAVASRHPNARISFVFGELDPLSYGLDVGDIGNALRGSMPIGSAAHFCAVLPGMRHNGQAAFPSLYGAIEAELLRPVDRAPQ